VVSVSLAESGPSPLLSVVVASYNRWPLVAETIESVLAQTVEGAELILVDDGSKDGTADEVEARYPTVRVIRQENTERGAAYNRGARESTGAYIGVLGSDDVWEPWHLEQFVEVRAKHPGAEVFGGRAVMWESATGRTQLHPDFDPATLKRQALLSAAIAPQAMVVSRDAFFRVGGFPEDRSTAASEDWVLLLKLLNRYQVVRLPRPSVRIREHAGRSMANLAKIRESREATTRLILEEDLLGFELDEESRRLIRAGTHRLCAAHHYGAGEMREARARIGDVCKTVGLPTGIRWTGRLWLQTWLGSAGSSAMRRVKKRLTWT
jgi:glycosyltransferase involved in cell wall biosynthesis